MLPQILIIEDDTDLQKFLRDLLTQHNFSVKTASTAASALRVLEQAAADLILLDLTLPDMPGESLFSQIRIQYPDTAIIMLTAKDKTQDKVQGLQRGADDYITKPFAPEELIARIQVRLRKDDNNNTQLKLANLVFDTKTMEVKRNGKTISLTPQEFKLLEYLLRNKGTVLTREMILNRIWMYSPDVETRVVDVYIGYLRKKIDSGQKKKLIRSKRGFGYFVGD
ncbi:DNA-binding response regulator [Candidatus Microgenomates bacterium]|nr:MAG: DNA-binding response regulator [Candidatus Microgenomates bacterium]